MIVASLRALAESEATPRAVREAARLLAAAIGPDGRGALPAGRSKLGPYDLIVSSAPGAAAEGLPFEAHRANADLHLVLEGVEGYRAACLRDCAADKPYDPASDAELFGPSARREQVLVLEAGGAAVFFPEDAHKPRCMVAGRDERPILKAVVKIPVEG